MFDGFLMLSNYCRWAINKKNENVWWIFDAFQLLQMGYGRRAMNLLIQYYEGNIPSLTEEVTEEEQIATLTKEDDVGLLKEVISPKSNLPPLLLKLSERPAEQLDYLGVSYGLTVQLLRHVYYYMI